MKFLHLIVLIWSFHTTLSQIIYDTPSGTRIVGGTIIEMADAPYQVALTARQSSGSYIFFCGGSLITSSLVVTAGHCMFRGGSPINPSDLLVFAGSASLSQVAEYSEVSWIKVHPDYYESTIAIHNDIALLKLNTSLPLDNLIKPIRLATAPTAIDTNCSISGWGSIAMNGRPVRDLRMAKVPIFNKTTCNNLYEAFLGVPLHSGTICAGYEEGGIDSCQGDSGGPMICNGVLTGVVSYGNGCALPGFPGIYTEIRQYLLWIVTNNASILSSALLLSLMVQIFTYVLSKY